tara:strand:- start:231 stop:2255 length:2025 start_codon:yes stop_codon:yes gene_type:complete
MANVTNIEIRAQDKTTTAFRKVNSGLNKLDANLRTTSGAMGLMNGGLGKMAGLMGGVIGIAAIKSFSSNLLKIGDRLQKVSLQLGISVEQLEIYQFAASQSGVNTEALNKSLQKFSINIGEAGTGAKTQVEAFEGLGISIHDTNGNLKDSPALFAEVATAISNLQSPTEKIRLATDLFGKSGVELVPLLNAGEQGIKNFEKTLRDAGGIIGGEAADAMAVFNDKIDILGTGLRGKLAPVLVSILPALTLLAENFDILAISAGVLAAAFIASKIWVFLGFITTGITALSIALAVNPFVIVAASVSALGIAALKYSGAIDNIFGFAETAPDDLQDTAKQTKVVEKAEKDLAKVEVQRNKIAEKFVKTSKKDVIPNLKKLEEGLGETQLKFVSLTGREGLGGIQLAFRNFFMNVWADATFYLGGTSQTIKKNFANMKQDFEEFFIALSNIVIFEGQNVRSQFSSLMIALETNVTSSGAVIGTAFSKIMRNLEQQVKDLQITVDTITIDVPASAFSFVKTKVDVPANIFDVSQVKGAQAKLNSLVSDINSYSYSSTSRTASRGAFSVGRIRDAVAAKSVNPEWSDTYDGNQYSEIYGGSTLEMPIPSVLINGVNPSSRLASSSSTSPAARSASRGGSDSGVIVNIFDGTGQKISAYDSGIRVEITERASRNSQFAALE